VKAAKAPAWSRQYEGQSSPNVTMAMHRVVASLEAQCTRPLLRALSDAHCASAIRYLGTHLKEDPKKIHRH
jgi:hypothetical protein